MQLPNLTPDLSNDAIGAELIQSNHFTISITAGTRQFTKIASAVYSWELQHIPGEVEEYFLDDDDDEEDERELVETEETYIVALNYHVSLDAITEAQEIIGMLEEFKEITVSIIYHTPQSNKPIFRHSFTGVPTFRAPLQGARSDAAPLTFTMLVDCSTWSNTTLV